MHGEISEEVPNVMREALGCDSQPFCPGCSGTSVWLLGSCRAFSTDSVAPSERSVIAAVAPGSLYRCPQCHLVFRNPVPSREQLDALYRRLPPTHWQYDAGEMSSWIAALQFLRARFSRAGHRSPVAVGQIAVHPAVPTSESTSHLPAALSHAEDRVRLLEVGPFDGAFLRHLPTDWERLAIEPSEAARQKLESEGVRVIADFLENSPSEFDGTCDAVCLFDVFEHLLSPTEGMRRALAYLKPGGLLLVSTGNADHWSWRLLQGQHWYVDRVGHVRFGSTRYFRSLARDCGCSLERLQPISHQRTSWRETAYETIVTLYFGLRVRSRPLRGLARMLAKLPGLRDLAHKSSPPYTQHLADHLLAVFERARCPATVIAALQKQRGDG